jgi:PAS domain S-box-containing protein
MEQTAGGASPAPPIELSGVEGLEQLLNAVPDAVFVTGAGGQILSCNQQAESLFGYPKAELIGQPVELLLPQRVRSSHVAHRSEYARDPRVRPMGIGLELFGLRRDGVEVPVEISLSPAEMRGLPVVIASVRDVSARKQLEAEREAARQQLESIQTVTDAALASLAIDSLLPALLERVRTVLHADTAAILLLDESGKNLVPRAALGLEEELEAGIRIPVGGGFAGRIASERRPIAVDDVDAIEVVNPVLRNRGLRSLLGAPLIIEDRLLGVVHVGTLQRRHFADADAELLRLVADRAALAIDRSRLYSEAQDAIRFRNEFLSAISHDLGNPVAAIRLESRLLRQANSGVEGCDENLLEGLGQIEATATRMWRQVQELLDLARLQVGRELELNWRPTDLVALVRDLTASQQALTDRHDIRLEIEPDALVGEWDSTRLERVITNLLSNAVKYSPEGGEIVVRVSRRSEPDKGRESAVLEVEDHGIGIPAEDLPLIFNRFHRAKNVRGRFAGTGIGLAGAKQIVDHHGGELIVESQERTGTTVTVRLPLDEAI